MMAGFLVLTEVALAHITVESIEPTKKTSTKIINIYQIKFQNINTLKNLVGMNQNDII